MERIATVTTDITEENKTRILELFPSVATETRDANGIVHNAIDFDALRELLGDIVEGQRERYQFTWPGKRASKEEARKPLDKTMRPILDRSTYWDTTNNLYIEGDNLEALKLLRSTYAGEIRVIYIDPPYNTGSDLIYDDDYALTIAEYSDESGNYNEDGGRLVENLESNGRFHSDWCSMMFPRLLIARDLLSSDGVIMISIGQAELQNLINICDEVFGYANRAGLVSRQMKTGNKQGKFFTQNTDYVVVYAKDVSKAEPLKDDMSQELIDKVYNKVQETGPRAGEHYRTMGLFQASLKHGGSRYPITCPDGERVITPEGLPWRWNETTFNNGVENDDVVFIKSDRSPLLNADTGERASWNIYTKIWLSSRLDEGQLPSDLILKFENRHAAKELGALGIPFDFPKPTALLKHLLHLFQGKDFTMLDFFGGSSTSAHALMQLNAEDGGNRRFILVQIPEEVDGEYKTICEIGEERIRRAGAKIVAEIEEANKQLKLGEEPKPVPDVGFRVLRIDSSNFTDTYATPDGYDQSQLHLFEDNVKPDRSDLDLLFQVLPTLRIPYSAKIEEVEVCGKRTFVVNGGRVPELVACFDVEVGADCIEQIAKMQPIYAVFRDASMADDATEANFEELFKTFSPDTVRTVI